VRRPERYKVPPGWRPIALRKISKGLETERRPGKEKEQVMTADEIIVGIDDSPSARAGLRWATAYARSTGTARRAIQVVDEPEVQDTRVYPVVADCVYPDASGWSVRLRQ
jgi:K+-sensing histidine kinase KdpD